MCVCAQGLADVDAITRCLTEFRQLCQRQKPGVDALDAWQHLESTHRAQIDAAIRLQSVLRMRSPAATFKRVQSGLSLLQAVIKGNAVRASFARDLQRLRDIQQFAMARGDRVSYQRRRASAVRIQSHMRMRHQRHAYGLYRAKDAIRAGLSGGDAAAIGRVLAQAEQGAWRARYGVHEELSHLQVHRAELVAEARSRLVALEGSHDVAAMEAQLHACWSFREDVAEPWRCVCALSYGRVGIP